MMSAHVVIPVRLDYWHRLTDDTGIFQHAKFGIPDRGHGYTTDDNARALIAAVRWNRRDSTPKSMSLIYTYLAFIYHAQNEDGSFKNFMNYDRNFIEVVGSEDSFGRALWAVGSLLAEPSVPTSLRHTGWAMLSRSLTYAQKLQSPRAKAYALIGLCAAAQSAEWPSDPRVSKGTSERTLEVAINHLASALAAQYQTYRRSDWHWFEDSMTYGNGMLPWSLFRAAQVLGRSNWAETARESLDFLASVTLSPAGNFHPIGCQGWLRRGGTAASYDEQPIEAAEMVMAFQAAYQSLGNPVDRDRMELCYEWFLGKNSQNLSLIDPETFGCYDGIEINGINLNQGAESILSYILAHLAMTDE